MRGIDRVVTDAARVFSTLRLRYAVVGGVTSSLLGRPRSTFDVDVVVDVRPEHAVRLARAFRARRYRVDPRDVVDALREHGHFSIFDTRSEYRIDAKGVYGDLQRWTLQDRRRIRLGRSYVYLDAPENLIVAKLLFGSEQDIGDAEAVYARHRGRLNVRRIAARAKSLGVRREWAALRNRSSTRPPKSGRP